MVVSVGLALWVAPNLLALMPQRCEEINIIVISLCLNFGSPDANMIDVSTNVSAILQDNFFTLLIHDVLTLPGNQVGPPAKLCTKTNLSGARVLCLVCLSWAAFCRSWLCCTRAARFGLIRSKGVRMRLPNRIQAYTSYPD